VELSDDVWVEQLTAGVWRHVSYRDFPNFGPVPSNGLIVSTRDANGAVLIDTAWNDAQTARILDWAQREVGAVRALVATHGHDDRVGGLQEVQRRGIRSVGLVATSQRALNDMNLALSDPFDGERSLDAFGVEGEVFFPGAGHSADNSVVWLAGSRTLFGGCLIKDADAKTLGNTADASLSGWPVALRALQTRYPTATRVVPGHREPGDAGLIDHTLDLLLAHPTP
jgi:glyoxylase-like metal-dependent hydrolase (beta-lactamase superfamily II)